jgi:RimJ/RimL family protein N-acetyltransferase
MGDIMVPFLRGEKIYLREIRPSDVSQTSAYYRWMNDLEVNRYFEHTGFFPTSIEALMERVTSSIKNPDIIALAIMLPTESEEAVHIGTVRIGPINWLHRFSELMITVDRPYWGKGYATEAVKLLRDHAFKKLNLHTLTAHAYSSNKASLRVLEKAGFTIQGTHINQFLLNGEYTDIHLLGMINPNHVAK